MVRCSDPRMEFCKFLIEDRSGSHLLAAGEYEIASIRMKVKNTQSTRVLTIFESQVEADPERFYSSVDGYAFLK